MMPKTLLAGLLCVLPEEVISEQVDVFGALSQWREVDGDDGDPIEEVLAELSAGDLRLEIFVGGGDHPAHRWKSPHCPPGDAVSAPGAPSAA